MPVRQLFSICAPEMFLSLSALALALPVTTHADDASPPQGVWTGKGQAGYTSSQGNSEAKSANAALDMGYVEGPWQHSFHLGGLYGESAKVVAAERWDTAWQSNYSFTKQFFGFGGLRYQHDLYNGFLYQESIATGVGFKIFDSTATKLDVQMGVGFKKVRPDVLVQDATGAVIARELQPIESGAIGTVGVNYSQAISATTTLTDKLLVESGSSDTLFTNALALAVKISTKLALSVGYAIQDNSKPPEGAKKLDTLETVNIAYSF